LPPVRRLLALVAGAVTAATGAVILGEYEMTGFTPVVAGLFFGVIVAEVVTVAGRRRDLVTAGACAASAFAGMVWGAWISAGQDHARSRWHIVSGTAWFGVVLAAAAAFFWVRTPERRAPGSRPAP